MSEKSDERKLGVRFFWALVLLLLLIIWWGGSFKLDVVSLSVGTVVPQDKVQEVQHLEGGIISHLYVGEGSIVSEGEVLADLESARSTSDLGELERRLQSLLLDRLRLRAEVEGRSSLKVGGGGKTKFASELVKETEERFKIRREALSDALEVQGSEIALKRQSIEAAKTKLPLLSEQLRYIQEQIDINERLVRDNISNRFDHLDLLKQKNRLEGQLQEQESLIEKSTGELSYAEVRRRQIMSTYIDEVRIELEKTERSLGELNERKKKITDQLRRTTIRSPVNGIVKTMYTYTTGGVLEPGGTLLEIVPNDSKLVIESEIKPQDIGHIKPGQEVIVRLATADTSRFSPIEGRVEFTSPDTIVGEDGQPYYLASIVVDKYYFGKGVERYPLVPGVLVLTGIITGKRSVWEYIFSPFIKSWQFSLTEI